MQRLGESLTDELRSAIQKHAAENQYSFAGGIDLTLERDDALSTGILAVDAELAKGEANKLFVIPSEFTQALAGLGGVVDGLRGQAPAPDASAAEAALGRPADVPRAVDPPRPIDPPRPSDPTRPG